MNEEAQTSTTEAPRREPSPSKGKPTPKKAAPKKAAPKKAVAKPAKKAKGKAKATTEKGPGVLKQYAPDYHKDSENKTAGGHTSIDNNDKLAQKLRGASIDDVYKQAAKVLEETEKDLRKKYGHLNVGMQRMNLGNRMRAVINAK